MRVGFAGTPAFAATMLCALVEAGFAVPIVLTQPDRPKGRGLQRQPSPVKALALERGLATLQPATLKSDRDRASLVAVPVDVLVVAAYGLILPPAVLAWPRYGCLNVHASLLPRWRGAAPIQRAILAGDTETGVTIMQMDAGLDTGGIVEAMRVPILPRETAATLTDKLAGVGATAIVGVLRRLADTSVLAVAPQSASAVTYAAKIDKAEAAIDWKQSVDAIDRSVRAFDPVPGAVAALRGEPIKVWKALPAAPARPDAPPGTVVAADAAGIVVACGTGALQLLEVQPAGSRRMGAAAFVAGRHIVPGVRLDTQAPRAANRESKASGG